jgi:hypothetical protein
MLSKLLNVRFISERTAQKQQTNPESANLSKKAHPQQQFHNHEF